MSRQNTLRIGEVATQAGVNIETLRYYERRGILEEPARTRSGYRQYPPETIRVIRFIKRAQDLGFTLGEIEDLLRLREDRTTSRADVRSLAETKIKDIEEKVRRLRAMRKALGILLDTCVCNGTRECPILEALNDDAAPRRRRNHAAH